MRVGLQLYTVKDEWRDDPRGTLRAVAAMGYQGVEAGGSLGMEKEEYRSLLAELGLALAGEMRSVEEFERDLPGIADFARFMDTDSLLIPGLWGQRFNGSLAAWQESARFLNDLGARCRAEGFTFQYHIHGQEFEVVAEASQAIALLGAEGAADLGVGTGTHDVTGMDVIIACTSPESLAFEVDTYWVDWGKGDALALSRRLAAGRRLGSFHMKDYASENPMRDAEVGSGLLDVPALLAVGKGAGLQWVVVEQEEFERSPLEAAAISAGYLRRALAN